MEFPAINKFCYIFVEILSSQDAVNMRNYQSSYLQILIRI